jgi:hypothetical protein
MTPERDGATRKTLAVLIAAQTLAADNTPASVDVRDSRQATIILAVGVGGITFSGTNKIEFVLTHSDDDSSYSAVTADDLIGDGYLPGTITGGIVRSLVAAHAAGTVQKIGYIGGKGYLKLLADFSGTHGSGTPIAATVVLEGSEFEGAA